MTHPHHGEPMPDPEHVLSPEERDDNAMDEPAHNWEE